MPSEDLPKPILIRHWAERLEESLSALLDGCPTEADLHCITDALNTPVGQREVRARLGKFLQLEEALRPASEGPRGSKATADSPDVSAAVLARIRAEHAADRQRAKRATGPGMIRQYVPPILTGAAAAVLFATAVQWRHQSTLADARLSVDDRHLRQVLRRNDSLGKQPIVGEPIPGAIWVQVPGERGHFRLRSPQEALWQAQQAQAIAVTEAEELPASQKR